MVVSIASTGEGVPSYDGHMPVDDPQSSEEPQSNLILTIFHRSRLAEARLQGRPNGSEPNDLTGEEFTLELAKALDQLPVPEDDVVSEEMSLGISRKILHLPQPLSVPCSALRKNHHISQLEAKYAIEIIFDQCLYDTSVRRRPLKLALFDMDSTLINEEVIDELARSIGISDAVSAITARAMNGEIDFATSLKERVGMLKGVPTTVWEDLKTTVTVAEGARELITGLRRRGVYTGVVSGGFTPMAEWLKEQLGLDIAVANHLVESPPTEEFAFAHLSGQLDPKHPIVTPELKRDTLLKLCAERSVPLSETLVVGDGSNDLLMLAEAGLGIAWRAKEKVQIAAPMRLNGKSLADLLYLLGPLSGDSENSKEVKVKS